MRGLWFGAAFALGLAGGLTVLEGDAAAGLTVEVPSSLSAAGAVRARMTLAKAKKKKRGGGASSKPDSSDSAGGDDDAPSKAAAASSDSGDDAAKEDDLVGSAPKKKKAAPRDDADASDGGGGNSSGRAAIKIDKPADGDDKPADTVSAKASDAESGAEGPTSALEFGVGARALFRNLQWTSDGRAAGLGPYTLTPGPETGLWLEFYPAAFGMTGFAANVGIYGTFNYGFGVATTLANGNNAATTFRDFQAGLKLRIPVGTFIPNVSVGYGQQTFAIAQQQTTLDLPQVAYQFVRPALGARVLLTPAIALDVTAAYLMVLDPGSGANQIRSSRFFPKATSYGIDVSASVGFRLTGTIGARAGADWRQYGIDLNPDSTTRSVAGAVDRYIVAWAGLEVVLDGSGSAGSDDEPAKPSKRKRHHASPPESDSSDSSSSDSSSSSSSDSSKAKSSDDE